MTRLDIVGVPRALLVLASQWQIISYKYKMLAITTNPMIIKFEKIHKQRRMAVDRIKEKVRDIARDEKKRVREMIDILNEELPSNGSS